jgi:hypothetical protein
VGGLSNKAGRARLREERADADHHHANKNFNQMCRQK